MHIYPPTNRNFKRFILMLAICMASVTYSAAGNAGRLVRGFVCDSITKSPLPGVSVIAEGGQSGTLSSDDGTFILRLPPGISRISMSCIGYSKRTLDLNDGDGVDIIVMQLPPADYTLEEVTVTRRKEKYSKKNNPAVELMKRLRSGGRDNDPVKNHQDYAYAKYVKTTLGLNDFKSKEEEPELARKYPFLWENVDTSEISGRPVLTFLVEEKISDVRYSSGNKKEVITARRRDGVDDFMDPQILTTFMEETMKEVDIFEPDINILYTRFVSPLSSVAPDFYKFYITDTVTVDDERCIVLTFIPRNKATLGFIGQIYVPEADSTMFIKKVSMRVAKDINLNFIDNLHLTQEFRRADDGSRLKTSDAVMAELSLMSGTQGLYAYRSTIYDDHNFDPPEDKNKFAFLGREKENEDAESRDSTFWNVRRPHPLPEGEKNMARLRSGLRTIPFFRYGVMIIRTLSDGYIHTAPGGRSKFDIGPLNTFVSHNYLEGWRLRVGGITTGNLSSRIFGKGYAAWGMKDHKLMYGGELEYSFIDKKYYAGEFPIRSIRLTHSYDINQLGQHYLFTNQDNIFVSWQRMKDVLIDYRRHTRLEWIMEWENNFSFTVGIEHDRQEATPDVPFINGFGRVFSSYSQTSATVQLRFAPGEKFFQTTTKRFPARPEVPIFILRHKVSPGGFSGNAFTINKTEVDIMKRFYFSAWGYLDGIIKGGHIWSQVAYPDLLIPNANLSYTIQPESFALMNPMEFITDTFAQWDLTYWANGAIFNYIPGVRKLGLREAFGFRGVWGRLSSKNDPLKSAELFRLPPTALNTEMNHGPYMEASVGIDNILKCLRVDYVWRLSYRTTPGIDRYGVRIAFHAAF